MVKKLENKTVKLDLPAGYFVVLECFRTQNFFFLLLDISLYTLCFYAFYCTCDYNHLLECLTRVHLIDLVIPRAGHPMGGLSSHLLFLFSVFFFFLLIFSLFTSVYFLSFSYVSPMLRNC